MIVNPARQAKSIKVAMQTHSIRHHLCGRNPSVREMQAILDWAARAGFDGFDVSDSWDFSALKRAEASEFLKMATDHGLAIPSINCIAKNLADSASTERYLRDIERGLEVATWFGSGIVNVSLSVPRMEGVAPVIGATVSPGGSRSASEEDYELTAAGLKTIARCARSQGLEISIELHDRSIADTSASLLKILNMTAEPNVKANPDICNGYRAYERPSETWQDALIALAPRANLWHVNNLQRVYFKEIQRAAFVECDLGIGDIDYVWALNLMRAAGFNGWIVIEYKGLGSAFEMLSRGREFLARNLVDPAIEVLQARFASGTVGQPTEKPNE